MYRKARMCCRTCWRTLPVLIIYCSFLSGGRGYGVPSYRLAREGYSPTTKILLIAVKDDAGNPLKRSWLAMYDEASSSVNRMVTPGGAPPFDFAWVPGRAAFVVTDVEGVTLFQKDDLGQGYTPEAVRCPTDALCTSCSWSPKGEWLAVNCLDRKNVTRGRLGLCRFGDNRLVKTGLGIDHREVVWGSSGLLYATDDDEVLTVGVKAEGPRTIRTSHLNVELTIFYGMFGEQPLFLSYDEVKLGDKTVATLDQPAGLRVVATETVAFVSASPGHLVAFDNSGRQIDKTNPGRLLEFGSVKDPNTAYAIAGSVLLRVSITDGRLNTQEICDLTKKLRENSAAGETERRRTPNTNKRSQP